MRHNTARANLCTRYFFQTGAMKTFMYGKYCITSMSAPLKSDSTGKEWTSEEKHLSRATKICSCLMLLYRGYTVCFSLYLLPKPPTCCTCEVAVSVCCLCMWTLLSVPAFTSAMCPCIWLRTEVNCCWFSVLDVCVSLTICKNTWRVCRVSIRFKCQSYYGCSMAFCFVFYGFLFCFQHFLFCFQHLW